MRILKLERLNQNEIVEEAAKVLSDGGLVVYPTETCYGMGVDATNSVAVEKLMKYKSRREGKPLSIAVTNREMASQYAEINEIAANLYENYLPGPITVVSKGLGRLAPNVESEFGTIGIRIPAYPLVLDIVKKLGHPITATSANTSYGPKPYSVESLLENLPEKQKEMIDLIIDAGELPHNEPSTVVDTTLNNLNVMREGSLKFNEGIGDEQAILKAHTHSAAETSDFGSLVMLKFIDKLIESPVILALRGELGAGKTQFVKGVARELKIKEDITSPTYTIIDEYKYQLADKTGYLVHMDTWRVDGVDELDRTGLAGYLKTGNVIAVEWADKFFNEILKLGEEKGAFVLKVDFRHVSPEEREIRVYPANL